MDRENEHKRIGKRIEELRIAKGLTQENTKTQRHEVFFQVPRAGGFFVSSCLCVQLKSYQVIFYGY